jgi:predicted nucleic acid-binding protein
LILLDSSCWLSFFTDEPGASRFLPILEDPPNLLVPTIVIYEVFRKILRERSEQLALLAASQLNRGVVADLTPQIAISAAKISVQFKLATADSVILATARSHAAVLWTQDAHFARVAGVRYFARK